jgi:hypothetical protein
MAIAKSTRSATRFVRARAQGRPHRARRESRTKKKGPARLSSKFPGERLHDLFALAVRLRAVFGTATTVELALRQQAAEQDTEIADCLREGLCNALFDEIDRLDGVIRQYGRELPGSKR